jgi:DNA-binding response OmpR family regulator
MRPIRLIRDADTVSRQAHTIAPRFRRDRAMDSGQCAHLWHPHRVLVVDDNPDAADSLAMLLEALGNDVRVAYDGEEAVDKAMEFSPHVVLLDIGLPKMHGYDVARKIRDAKGLEVTLVAVTGWAQEEDRRRSSEAGFDYHFTKPVDPDDLVRVVAAPRLSRQH